MTKYEDIHFQFKATMVSAEECGVNTASWFVDHAATPGRYKLCRGQMDDWMLFDSLDALYDVLHAMEQAYNTVIDLKG